MILLRVERTRAQSTEVLSLSCEAPLDTWAFLCPKVPVEMDGPTEN